MDQLGFIHDKLDIKILILFVLRRLPAPVDPQTLLDLCQVDDGMGYFDYSDCISDLLQSGHMTETEEGFRITEKGERNADATESSLPYSVRLKADRAVETVAAAQKRSSLIGARHAMRRKGGYTVSLSLSDGIGPILEMELYAANEAQAEKIEKKFRRDAEKFYTHLMEELCGE